VPPLALLYLAPEATEFEAILMDAYAEVHHPKPISKTPKEGKMANPMDLLSYALIAMRCHLLA
jgi:hypothetical protein